MTTSDGLRFREIPLSSGAEIPALGFGTLIPDLGDTIRATRAALETGFRHLDCAERYRNESAVGEALQAVLQGSNVKRDDVFIGTKLWNNHHRPERVKPAFEASLMALRLDHVDLYMIHTPYAFLPGDEQDPRDEKGQVIYDPGVTLSETWGAMERLVDEGKVKSIGLSDVSLEHVQGIVNSARIRPAVVQVESHPYLPQPELLQYCKEENIVLLAFAALGHSSTPRLLDDPVITKVATETGMTPAQVCIAWGVQRGTAILTTSKNPEHIRESFAIADLPDSAMTAINAITTRYRFNPVVHTGIPGFIPRGS
jgi:diketogulonate reductase-like aldo/keto reductase